MDKSCEEQEGREGCLAVRCAAAGGALAAPASSTRPPAWAQGQEGHRLVARERGRGTGLPVPPGHRLVARERGAGGAHTGLAHARMRGRGAYCQTWRRSGQRWAWWRCLPHHAPHPPHGTSYTAQRTTTVSLVPWWGLSAGAAAQEQEGPGSKACYRFAGRYVKRRAAGARRAGGRAGGPGRARAVPRRRPRAPRPPPPRRRQGAPPAQAPHPAARASAACGLGRLSVRGRRVTPCWAQALPVAP